MERHFISLPAAVFKEPTPETPTAPTEAEKGTPKKKKKSSAGGEGKLKKKKKREGSGGVASALAPAQGAPTLQKKKSVAGSLSGDSLNESTDESSSLTLAADDEDDALAQDEDGLEIEVKERIKEPLTAYELEEVRKPFSRVFAWSQAPHSIAYVYRWIICLSN